MAADIWRLFPSAIEKMSDGTFDMDLDTFHCVLLTSSYTPDSTDAVYTDLSNELTTLDGYTLGGKALTNVTWVKAGETTTLDSDDVSWDATGSGLTARYAVIYNFSDTGKGLLCIALLDTTPGDVFADNGDSFTVEMNASGIFAITSNWSD